MSNAEKRMDKDYVKFRQEFADLQNQMGDAFRAAFNGRVLEADLARARCVVQHGWKSIGRVQSGADGVPYQQLFAIPPGHTSTDEAAGTQTYIPSAREAELALALLRCSRELGLPAKLLAEAKAAQLPVVGRFERQILELNAQVDKFLRKAAEVLK